ncbi:MAG: cation acetate symporter [Planctomycetales bacterium]|nr:cation acetate symporter [Planctomycetales bacterium]
MIYEASTLAVAVFFAFVAFTLGISFYLGSKAKSASGYFAAHGEIHWFVNGVAFAGDYLSAASFLGICGMIAFYGYDGFLYSIGFLAGWIVALFVIAEPMKRLGKFTFADALDAKFQSRGIKLAAGISTLIVSVFYLIPQMVGAGALVTPLLGFEHWQGVLLVGVTVVLLVVTAGMVSTTYVQFLKGALLVIFSTILTVMILNRGFEVKTGGRDGHEFEVTPLFAADTFESDVQQYAVDHNRQIVNAADHWADDMLVVMTDADGRELVFSKQKTEDGIRLFEAQAKVEKPDGTVLINGLVQKAKVQGEPDFHPVGHISKLSGGKESTGPLGTVGFLRELQDSEIILWGSKKLTGDDGTAATVYYQKPTPGDRVLRPGEHPKFKGIRSGKMIDKLNFLSLMIALFCGTASLPHILIRYYTVKDEAAARASTIVGIGTIGFFYVLTLFLGLGAMTSGSLDVTNTNMAAPLLAKSIGEWLFAIISAIAFTTVLGTVSGLILASAGAVTHDLLSGAFGIETSDSSKVRIAKISSVIVGAIAIVLGILFKEMNVGFLVGWAFHIAASANLPALVMLLFWKGTTRQGIIAAIVVGMVSSLGWILLSSEAFDLVYGLPASNAIVPFSQPGIVTIPLGFLTLVIVSLLTDGTKKED